MLLEDKLRYVLPEMKYRGERGRNKVFYKSYEEDFTFEFYISKCRKGYDVVVQLYLATTSFPVRAFSIEISSLEELPQLYEKVYNKCKKMSKEMDGLVD